MSRPLFTNNAATNLAEPITPLSTILQVTAGTGGYFPQPSIGDYFMLTLVQANNPAVSEIVECIGRSGDILTVVRGQEGTTPQTFNLSDNVELRITASSLNLFAIGGGSGGTASGTSVADFTATAGQTVFTLPWSYTQGIDNLTIFVNGSKQIVNVNYVETSTTSFTMANGLNVGDIVEAIYNLPLSGGVINASNVTYNQGSPLAVNQSVQDRLRQTVSVFDFMTPAQIASVQARDGLVDVTAAIQAALDCVPNYAGAFAPSKASGGAGEVTIIFPDGVYAVSSVLINNQRSYSKLIGEGKAAILSTSTTYVIDLASCFYCDVSNFRIDSATAGVGIYMNRATSNPYCDYNTINNVDMYLTKGITANGGTGTIGLYMNRVEQNMFTNCEFNADCPLWNDNAFDAAYPVTNGTQDATITSNTINTFIQCNWRKYGTHQFGIRLKGALGFEFINNYFYDWRQTAGATPYMVSLDGCVRVSFSGNCENIYRFASVSNYNYFNNFDLLTNASYLDTGGYFNFDSPTINVLSNCNISVFINGDMTGKYVFVQTSALASPRIEGNIIRLISTSNGFSVLSNALVTANIYLTEASLSIGATNISSLQYAGVNGVTASTASGTPVTIFAPLGTYAYQVYAYVSGAGANYVATSIVVNDGSTNNLLSYSHGANLTITVAGANIQCTQTSGAAAVITYKYIAIV
jgi:hypothetical protein